MVLYMLSLVSSGLWTSFRPLVWSGSAYLDKSNVEANIVYCNEVTVTIIRVIEYLMYELPSKWRSCAALSLWPLGVRRAPMAA